MDLSRTQELYKRLWKLGKKNPESKNFKIIGLGSKS